MPNGMIPLRTYQQHTRAIIVLGAPLVGSQLAQIAIHTTDTVMLGWYGVDELAGATIATSLFFIVFILGTGFAWAVMPLAAAATEIGDKTQTRRVTRMGLWACLVYCLLGVPVLLSAGGFFHWLGQEPEVADLAGQYLRIAGWMLVPALVVMVMRSFLSALELTQIVLWVTVGAAVLNVLMNYVLIFGNYGAPELGVQGAAISSVTINTLSAVVLVVYALRKLPDYTLLQRLWRPDWAALKRVFALGWPIGITNIAEVALFAWSSFAVGWLGAGALAAHAIALQLASIMFMFHIGLSQAATVRAGRAFGRQDGDGLKTGALVVIALSLFFVLVTMVLFLAIPRELMGFFLAFDNPQRAEIVALGALLLAYAALFQLADAMQVIALGLLRGVQDTRMPMIYAALSYWGLGAPSALILAFPLGMGAPGIWLGLVIGLSLAAVTMMTRFWRNAAKGYTSQGQATSEA